MIDIHQKHNWPLGKILEGHVLEKTAVKAKPSTAAIRFFALIIMFCPKIHLSNEYGT